MRKPAKLGGQGVDVDLMRRALDHLVRVMGEAEAGKLDRYAIVGVSAARGVLEHQRWLAEREDATLAAQLARLLGDDDKALAFLDEQRSLIVARLSKAPAQLPAGHGAQRDAATAVVSAHETAGREVHHVE